MRRPDPAILIRRLMACVAVVVLAGSARAEPPRTDRLGDPLPSGAVTRLGTLRLRHSCHITAVAFAPDGKTFASGSWDGTVRIWETATGRELHCCSGQDRQVHAIAFAPDGKLMASSGKGGVFFWDPATGAERDHLGGNAERVEGLAFAPDGKTLAAVMDGRVVMWDLAGGTLLYRLDRGGPGKSVFAVAYSPDGRSLAVADHEEVRVHDAATGKEVRKLLRSGAYSIAYSPDGKRLAVATTGKKCLLLDASTGEEIGRAEERIHVVAYAPDGRTVAALGWYEDRPWLWDLSRRKMRWPSSERQGKSLQTIAFSPDGKLLVGGGDAHRIRLWDVAAARERDLLGDGAGQLASALSDGDPGQPHFVLSGDGQMLAALDDAQRICLWDTANGKFQRRKAPEIASFAPAALSPDGTSLAVFGPNGADDYPIQVLDTATGRPRWQGKACNAVLFAAFSGEGKTLASGGFGNVIELWEAATGRSLGQLRGHRDPVIAGAFSPDGKTLVTASKDHTVRVWDVPSKAERHRLKGHGGGATVWRIVFSSDGARIVTGGDDGRICVWDAHTGRRLRRWTTEDYEVNCLALSPDGNTLVSNVGDGRFCLWDVAAGTAGPPIEGHRAAVTRAAFRADGRTLLTASQDGTALVWDVAALRRRKPPQPAPARTDLYGDPLPPGVLARLGSIRLRQSEGVIAAAFSADGKILVAAGTAGRCVHFWDPVTGKELRHLLDVRSDNIEFISLSPDGKVLAGQRRGDSAIHFWDVASGASLGTAVRHSDAINCFAFSPDGKTLAAAGGSQAPKPDFTIHLWDLDTGEEVRSFQGHRAPIQQVAFTAGGKTLLSFSEGRSVPEGEGKRIIPAEVRVWDVPTGKLRHRYQAKDGMRCFAPDGQTFVYSDKEKIHVCSAATGRELWSTQGRETEFVYSPDGKYLLSCLRDQTPRLWEAATGKEVGRSAKAIGPFTSLLCLSPDKEIVATTTDSEVRLWDVATGREHRPFGGHESVITCMDFAPDGRTLASGGLDATVRLWETATGKELRVFRGHEADVRAVAFSRDGKTIASGDSRNTVRLWDTATGKELLRFRGPPFKADREEGVWSIAFSADGQTLIAASADGTIRLWDAVTHKLRRQIRTHAGPRFPMVISPDGKRMALLVREESNAGVNFVRCEVHLWSLTAGREVHRICGFKDEEFGAFAFSPDGKVFAVNRSEADYLRGGLQSSEICFWETSTGQEIRRLRLRERVWDLAFAPDGMTLFTDGALRDPVTGEKWGEVSDVSKAGHRTAFSPDGRLLASGNPDDTILIWPVPQPVRRKPIPPREPPARELQALWNDLSSADAPRAWRAVHALIALPGNSVPFLQTVLRPHPPIDRRRLERLLADLDGDDFAVREQARRELQELGELAEPALRRVLDGKPSLEVRRRVLALLEKLEQDTPSAGQLRALRVTAVLEHIGTPEAVGLLRRLAGGAAEARLTREAAAALERLKRRAIKP